MAIAAEDAEATYLGLLAAQRAALASPKPSYSVDGVSLDWGAYYRMLSEQVKAAREAWLATLGPFEVTSVAR